MKNITMTIIACFAALVAVPGHTEEMLASKPEAKPASTPAVVRTFAWERIPECKFIKDRVLENVILMQGQSVSNSFMSSVVGLPLKTADTPAEAAGYEVIGEKTSILLNNDAKQVATICGVDITGAAVIMMTKTGMTVSGGQEPVLRQRKEIESKESKK